MVLNTNIGVELDFKSIPIIPNAREFAIAGIIPGGTKNNLDWVSDVVEFKENRSEIYKFLLADAQTSGGLLIAINPNEASDIMEHLKSEKIDAAIIGKFTVNIPSKIIV
jgi:selenide,water dikinase